MESETSNPTMEMFQQGSLASIIIFMTTETIQPSIPVEVGKEEKEQQAMVEYMKAAIRANEVFVNHVFSKLEERVLRVDTHDVLSAVYQRFKSSATPSVEKLTEAEEQGIQTIWKQICEAVAKERGQYGTVFSDFQKFEEQNQWFVKSKEQETERFDRWLQVFDSCVRVDDIVFFNKRYGVMAYDLYRGGSTAIKIIIETLIDPYKSI